MELLEYLSQQSDDSG